MLERAAEAFGLSLDALGMLSTLKAVGAVLDQLETAAWAGAGLTPAQGWVLAHLVLIGPSPQHVIAQRLMVTPSSISQVASRLEAHGLLTRRTDRADGRVRHLAATPAAEQRVRAVVPRVRQVLEAAETAVGPGEVGGLLDRLDVLHHSLLAAGDLGAAAG